MQIQHSSVTDVGQVRTNNEDSFAIDDVLRLFVVCDGMGGHAAGEVASSNATELLISQIKQHRELAQNADKTPDGVFRLLRLMEESVQEVCRQLYEMALSDPERAGMGTTLTLVMFVGSKGIMAHVGDSRLYLKRGENLFQLSNDHTLANEMHLQGLLSAKQARESKFQHVLTRSLGPHPAVEVETLLFDVLTDDVFLLCTDGLSNYLTDEQETVAMLSADEPRDAVRRLVGAAIERGGNDNVTAIVLHVQSGGTIDCDESQDFLDRIETLKSVFLFDGLSLRRLLRLMNIATCRDFRQGETILSTGETLFGLYIVLKGQVGLDGEILKSGDTFGSETLFNKSTVQSKVHAATACQLLVIPAADFQSLTRRVPKLGRRLLTQLSKHLSNELARVKTVGDDLMDTIDL